ncbi:hypothetical protein [Rhizobium sp. ZPR3]|uniref:DUF2147 domain-containing protein n=2 Tax=unclassified Rhizobium TaxID=2613769 RepID=A0AAU7SLC4_9HYPH
MTIKSPLSCAFCVVVVLAESMKPALASPAATAPQLPTMQQLQSALDEVKPGLARIREFFGCIPAFGRPMTIRLCALKAEGTDFVQTIPFRLADQRWQVVLDRTGRPPETDGACAPLDVVQAELRKLRGDGKLHVTGEVDDGAGTFTSERGLLRDHKGPYRLMCRYDVVTGLGKKALLIAYVWHDGAHYIVDRDIEAWPDD